MTYALWAQGKEIGSITLHPKVPQILSCFNVSHKIVFFYGIQDTFFNALKSNSKRNWHGTGQVI